LSEDGILSIHLKHRQGQESRIKKGVPALTQDSPLLETDFIGPCQREFLHTDQIYTLTKKKMGILMILIEYVLIFSVLIHTHLYAYTHKV